MILEVDLAYATRDLPKGMARLLHFGLSGVHKFTTPVSKPNMGRLEWCSFCDYEHSVNSVILESHKLINAHQGF